jgi:hypothetical protein
MSGRFRFAGADAGRLFRLFALNRGVARGRYRSARSVRSATPSAERLDVARSPSRMRTL